MRKLKYFGWIAALCLTVGCASTRQFVAFPNQNNKLDNADNARIYVLRPVTFGAAISMEVKDGDTVVGKTGPHSYLSWERKPGDTTITSIAENTSSLELSAEKGMTYYILQYVKMGFWTARTKLELIDAEKGLEYLKKCNPPSIGN